MAVDTPAKRLAMMDFGNPIVTGMPLPTGAFGVESRAHALNLYSNLAFIEVVIQPGAGVLFELMVSWDNSGNFDGSEDDITGYVDLRQKLTTRIGRDNASQLSGRSVAGTLACRVKNEDGRFSSFNVLSPIYGQNRPGRPVRLRASLDPSHLLPDIDYWADRLSLNDNDPITTMPDLSGNGYDASEAGTNRPIYKVNILNGRSIVRHSTVDSQRLRAPISGLMTATDGPFTVVFLGVTFRSPTAGADNEMWSIGDPTALGKTELYNRSGANTLQVVRRDDASTQKVTGNFGVDDTLPHVIATTFNGTHATVRVDGVDVLTSFDLDVGVQTLSRFSIGDYNGARHSDLDWNRALVFNRELTTAELDRIDAWASLYYALESDQEDIATVWRGFLSGLVPLASPGRLPMAELRAQGPLAWLNDPSRQASFTLQGAILTGEAMDILLDEVGWPADARDVDPGETEMVRFYMSKGSPLRGLRQLEATEAGFLRELKNGSVGFEGRHHRLTDPHTTVVATYGDMGSGFPYKSIQQDEPWAEVFNTFKATIQEYEVGALAVLWTWSAPSGAPRIFPVGSTKVFWAEYPTKNSANTAVGVDAWTTPVAGTDFNVTELGVGTDLNGSIAIVVEKFATTMKISLTNNSGLVGIIQLLRARGTPLTSLDPVTIAEEDTVSQLEYGPKTYPHQGEFIPTVQEAQDWADFNLAIYKDAIPRLTILLPSYQSDELTIEALTRDISDRVEVIASGGLTRMGIAEEFFVESIAHSIGIGNQFETLISLSPVRMYGGFWVLGVSTLGETTKLAY